MVSYAVGIGVQVPFLAQSLYTGPLTDELGGADISWIVGLIVTGALYYAWASRTSNPPARMIYPEEPAAPTDQEHALAVPVATTRDRQDA